jgi:hypothetical protein
VVPVRWGAGPRIGGRETLLWCAWLSWSRFRVVIPTWDRTLPTVVACLDETLRRFGGAPTYALTDNERTVTIDRVAGIGVRHPELVAAGRHYGLQITACEPFDPESKVLLSAASSASGLREWNDAAQSPLSMNRFLYAQADAATLVDPTGHAGCPPGERCAVAAGHLSSQTPPVNATATALASTRWDSIPPIGTGLTVKSMIRVLSSCR